MIGKGKLLKPYKVDFLNGGATSRFHVPQMHRQTDGSWHQDGFVYVLYNGDLNWTPGELIKVKELKGVTLREKNGKSYVTVYAELELPKTRLPQEKHEDDVPEDLF